MPGSALISGHDRFLENPSKLIIHFHLMLRSLSYWKKSFNVQLLVLNFWIFVIKMHCS
jgi:hypothetical protein